jgi:hypothetical protein
VDRRNVYFNSSVVVTAEQFEVRRVRQRPIGRLVPSPDKDGFLPEEVTVTFANGTVRVFNPDDQVLIGTVRNSGPS